MLQSSNKITFLLSEALFHAIEVDENKCCNYRKDAWQIKVAIQVKSDLATLEYDKYIQMLLEYIEGSKQEIRFSSKNHFDFLFLAELFKVSDAVSKCRWTF